MSPLVFRPRPPAGTGGPRNQASAHWLRVAHELRQRSGEDAIVKANLTQSRAAGLSKRIRSGAIEAFAPAGAFDAASRREADGTYTVYACHVPAGAEAAASVAEPTPIRRRKAAGGAR